MNNKYVVIPTEDLTEQMAAASWGTVDTVHKNLAGTKTILAYSPSDKPEIFNGYPTYTHQEALSLMAGEDWSFVDEGN